jgi:hypothetical protein
MTEEELNIQNEEDRELISSVVPQNVELEKKKEELRKKKEELLKKGGKPTPLVLTESGVIKKATDLTVAEQRFEFVKCATDPIYFIETYLTIFDQTKGEGGALVPFKLFEFQKRLIRDYQKHRFNVANKYRQAGISTATCAYISWYVIFNENRAVAIVADKLETARDEIMFDVVEFIEGLPDWLKPKPDKKDTQKLKKYDNGSSLGAFSSKGLRGYTPTLLFWDETAWTERNDRFWEGAKPTLQTGGRAIFVSCVTEDTFIYTDKGIKQVKEFIASKNLGAHNINDINILGKDKCRKTNIFFNNGYVDTYKTTTSHSELETSENHKYWAYKNNKYGWVKAKDLKIGDYISIQYGMNIWGNNNNCSDFKPSNNSYIKNIFTPKTITKDIAYLIGLYISEGSVIKRDNKRHTYYGITITCGDDISFILKKLNLNYSCTDNIHYNISSIHLAEYLAYLGFDLSKKAPEKIIPQRLLKMSKNNIIAMMQGIMDGDGWCMYDKTKDDLKIGITLSSKELIKQIRIILDNFGVLTHYSERVTPPTEIVKIESMGYRLTATSDFAVKYFNEINFKLKRKKKVFEKYLHNKKHSGRYDNIPNGGYILKELYESVKYYGIHKLLTENNLNIKDIIQRNFNHHKPTSRKTILNFIKLFKEKIPIELLKKYENIISENIKWVQIKKIENSQNYTYDFSMSNDNEIEDDEFHMSLIYNSVLCHNTPNSQDPVFYKTFDTARRGENHWNAVELWWYNDPRYNKELKWIKNKGKENEIIMEDKEWSDEHRIKLADDGWSATSPWLDEEIANANGDMRKIMQEIMCVGGNTIITLRNKQTKMVFDIKIKDFYNVLEKELIDNIIISGIIRN